MHLLLLTAGETDIQLVDQRRGRRFSFAGRALHQQLIEHAHSLKWIAATDSLTCEEYDEERVPSKRGNSVETVDGETSGAKEFEQQFCALLAGGDDSPCLCAPKIAPLLRLMASYGDGKPDMILVLNTWRDENSSRGRRKPFAGEPFAVGPLLAALAARELSIDDALSIAPPWKPEGGARASYLNYLIGNEDHTKVSDKLAAAARIHKALLSARGLGVDKVTIADTGGIPEFKEVTRMLATLVFGESNVRGWRNSETGDPSDQPIWATPEARIRLHLMLDGLLAKGNVEAAYNVAATFGIDRNGIELVSQLPGLRVGYQLLAGFQREYVGNRDGAAQKGRWPLGNNFRVPAAFVAAMRAEEALRRCAFPQAITHTIEFFEWSFLGALENLLRDKLGGAIEVSANKRIENCKLSTERIAEILGLERTGDTAWKYTTRSEADRPERDRDRAILLSSTRDNCTEVGNKRRERKLWTQLMGDDAKGALLKLSEAIETAEAGELAPIDFRNAQAHNGYAITSSRYYLGHAVDAFKKRGLWADSVNTAAADRAPLGALFLEQSLVRDVLKTNNNEITDEPATVYRNWIEKLRDEVRQCSSQ